MVVATSISQCSATSSGGRGQREPRDVPGALCDYERSHEDASGRYHGVYVGVSDLCRRAKPERVHLLIPRFRAGPAGEVRRREEETRGLLESLPCTFHQARRSASGQRLGAVGDL